MSFDSPIINIISAAMRKAMKPLVRDYGEIMHLQSSPKGTKSFALKTYNRVKDIIFTELTEARPNFKIYEIDNIIDEECDFRWIVVPIDGIENFEHGIPLFCSCVILQKRDGEEFKTMASMVEAPGLEEVYCVERGSGAWSENYSRFSKGRIRMRVSNRIGKGETVIAANFNNSRYKNYGSDLLSLILVAAGKIDACIFKTNETNKYSFLKLFIEESGGVFRVKEDLIAAGNHQFQLEISKL